MTVRYQLPSVAAEYVAMFPDNHRNDVRHLVGRFHAWREVDPIDRKGLAGALGRDLAARLLEVFDAGLAPDPDRRASLQTLGRLCRRSFEVEERESGLPLRQTALPPASADFYV